MRLRLRVPSRLLGANHRISTHRRSTIRPFGPFRAIPSQRDDQLRGTTSGMARARRCTGAAWSFWPAARYPGLEAEPDLGRLGPVHELWTALRGGAADGAAPRLGPNDVGVRVAMTEEDLARRSHAGPAPAQWHAASFEPVPRSVREARQFVGSLLEDPYLRETSELLVSELTTNALQHAVGEFEVRVRAEPPVRVEVRDRSSLLPTPKDLAPSDESGRGLHIVIRLATSWGTRKLPEGKVVWFEL